MAMPFSHYTDALLTLKNPSIYYNTMCNISWKAWYFWQRTRHSV